jgi:hypothetical protein
MATSSLFHFCFIFFVIVHYFIQLYFLSCSLSCFISFLISIVLLFLHPPVNILFYLFLFYSRFSYESSSIFFLLLHCQYGAFLLAVWWSCQASMAFTNGCNRRTTLNIVWNYSVEIVQIEELNCSSAFSFVYTASSLIRS